MTLIPIEIHYINPLVTLRGFFTALPCVLWNRMFFKGTLGNFAHLHVSPETVEWRALVPVSIPVALPVEASSLDVSIIYQQGGFMENSLNPLFFIIFWFCLKSV